MDTQQQYEQALKRAHDEGCRIVGESAYNGNRAWVVQNPAHDGHYIVRLAAGAHELSCSCPARVPCKHRALCHEALERETRPTRVTILQLQAARKAALQSTLWQ
jgi:hypothetical protein